MARLDPAAENHVTLPERIDLAVIDVSFISLTRVLGGVVATLQPVRGEVVALVKPQFEAGAADAPGGVGGHPAVHRGPLDKGVR